MVLQPSPQAQVLVALLHRLTGDLGDPESGPGQHQHDESPIGVQRRQPGRLGGGLGPGGVLAALVGPPGRARWVLIVRLHGLHSLDKEVSQPSVAPAELSLGTFSQSLRNMSIADVGQRMVVELLHHVEEHGADVGPGQGRFQHVDRVTDGRHDDLGREAVVVVDRLRSGGPRPCPTWPTASSRPTKGLTYVAPHLAARQRLKGREDRRSRWS